jgi:hypothetical protein
MGGCEVMAAADGKAGVEVAVWMSGLVAPYLGTSNRLCGSCTFSFTLGPAQMSLLRSKFKQREVI